MSPMLITINRLERRRALADSAKHFVKQVAVCAVVVVALAVANTLWG